MHAPTGGGYYSSEKIADTSAVSYKDNYWEKHEQKSHKENSFGSFLKKLWEFGLKIIRKGNGNSFEVLKGGESKASFPLTVLALLVIFAFWVGKPIDLTKRESYSSSTTSTA